MVGISGEAILYRLDGRERQPISGRLEERMIGAGLAYCSSVSEGRSLSSFVIVPRLRISPGDGDPLKRTLDPTQLVYPLASATSHDERRTWECVMTSIVIYCVVRKQASIGRTIDIRDCVRTAMSLISQSDQNVDNNVPRNRHPSGLE